MRLISSTLCVLTPLLGLVLLVLQKIPRAFSTFFASTEKNFLINFDICRSLILFSYYEEDSLILGKGYMKKLSFGFYVITWQKGFPGI